MDGHLPGVDYVDGVGAGRQREVVPDGLVEVEVVEDDRLGFSAGIDGGGIEVIRFWGCCQPGAGEVMAGAAVRRHGGFEDLAEKGNTLRAGSFELAAMRPPDSRRVGFIGKIVGVDEGFAVGDVTTRDDA